MKTYGFLDFWYFLKKYGVISNGLMTDFKRSFSNKIFKKSVFHGAILLYAIYRIRSENAFSVY